MRLHSCESVHSMRAQDTRLEHRFVDLRTPANQAIFRLQSAVCQVHGQAGQSARAASSVCGERGQQAGMRSCCEALHSVHAAPRSILVGCMCPSDRRAGRFRLILPTLSPSQTLLMAPLTQHRLGT